MRGRKRPWTSPCRESCAACARRFGPTHLVIHLNLAVIKIVLGLSGGSKTLAVSAMYSLRDGILAAMVIFDARRPVRDGSSAPWKLAAVVAAGMSLLILASVALLGASILHGVLHHPPPPPAMITFWLSLFSAAACWALAHRARCAAGHLDTIESYVQKGREQSLIMLLVAGTVLVARRGPVALDAIFSTIEALAVVLDATRFLRSSVAGLMEAAVNEAELAQIWTAVGEVQGAAARREPRRENGTDEASGSDSFSVGLLRATRNGYRICISLDLWLPAAMRIASAERLRDEIDRAVRQRVPRVGDLLVSFQVDPQVKLLGSGPHTGLRSVRPPEDHGTTCC